VTSSQVHDASVQDLLAQYAAILEELRRRGIARTRNAPLGDYAEYLTAAAYNGTLAANSEKSYDVTGADGRLLQVKARTIGPGVRGSAKFSAFRSFDFDVAVFLAFDLLTYELAWAREVPRGEVQEAVRYSPHTNASNVRIRSAQRLGVDVTARFTSALAPVRTLDAAKEGHRI
jgi:hypothetical protein